MGDTVAKALYDTLRSPNEHDQNGEIANVTDGLFAIAAAINSLARAVDDLGFGRMNDPVGKGAMEGHTMIMRDVMTEGMMQIAGAINEGLQAVADSIEKEKDDALRE